MAFDTVDNHHNFQRFCYIYLFFSDSFDLASLSLFSPTPKGRCYLRTYLAILLSLFSFLANSSILTCSFNYKFCNANSQICQLPYTLPQLCNTFPTSSGTPLTSMTLKIQEFPFCSSNKKRKLVVPGAFSCRAREMSKKHSSFIRSNYYTNTSWPD